MKLTREQEKLFSEWKGSDPYDGFNFTALMARTGRPREEIRRIVREIASIGYLEFMRGCFTDEGEPYGSAYVLTLEGYQALKGGSE